MRQLWYFLLTFLLLFASLGANSLHAGSEITLEVIVNAASPVKELSAYEIEALFTRTQSRWSDGTAVIPLSFPMNSEARVLFDRVALRLNPDEVGRFWLDRRIRGLGLPPRQVPAAALMSQVVANLSGAVGYLPRRATTTACAWSHASREERWCPHEELAARGARARSVQPVGPLRSRLHRRSRRVCAEPAHERR